MAGIVYEGVRNTTGDGGKLFDGQNFWFSSAVPQRKWLIENAIANGATVVSLEKQADVLIVDHARKNAPIGTHSYRYIEQSIRNGRLEDLADHVVGPSKSTDRPVGSMITAPKGSRSKYTDAEDQLLWNFIKPYENAGGATGGNEIYKQLEEAHGNGRHTYQSWRDRWLKHVKFQNRQITDTVYAASDEDSHHGEVELVPQISPRKRVPVFATPPTSTPRRAVGAASPQTPVSGQNWSNAASGSSENAAIFYARQALQRKLGRLLPSSPTSLSARHWEPVPVSQRAQVLTPTKAVGSQDQQAGLDTHLPVTKTMTERDSTPASQPAAEAGEVAIPSQSSKVSLEEFTEDEYKLLLDAAEHIIRVGDTDEDSWEMLAVNYPNHSAQSWKEFWEGKVKPDYQKHTPQIKKEQTSQEASFSPELNKHPVTTEHPEDRSAEASSSDKDFQPPSQSDEEADDEIESAVEEDENGEVVEEEVWLEEDGLSSLFDSQDSSSAQDSSPFACRWLGCNANISNLYMLVKHVAKVHKPSSSQVVDEHGWLCKWVGCRKVRVDKYGNESILDLQSRQVWVNHYIDEHIKPINRKHGLGPSLTEVQEARRGLVSGRQSAVQAEEEDPELAEEHLAAVSTPRREQPAQVDRASEEAEQEGNSADYDSGEAKETGSTSSLAERAIEDNSETSDFDGQSHSNIARRSKRLRNVPQSQHVKDLGFSYVDKAVGSSPPLPVQKTPARGVDILSIQPLSPQGVSKPPEPNEARKRSASKGNSQESTQSTSNGQETLERQAEESEQQSVMLSSRKHTREPESETSRQYSPELPTRINIEPKIKRRKQGHFRDEPPEIPSTPEQRATLGELQHAKDDNNSNGSSMLGNSPTPRPSMPRLPARSGLDNISLPGTSSRSAESHEGIEHTSPLHVSMFSDPDTKTMLSSPARSPLIGQDELSSEPDPDFETALQTTSVPWGTAPLEEQDGEDANEEDQFETAPEPKGKGRERLDTQFLFAQNVPDIDGGDDPFALPEPDGGWPEDMNDDDELGGPLTELPIPTSYQPERANAADEEEHDNNNNDNDNDASSISSDVPGWVAERTSKDDSLDVEILLCAIQATSGFNEKLIIEVHDFLLAKRLRNDPETLPMYMKGCWTTEDDLALNGTNGRERLRILKKHGRDAVERRIKWLNEEI